MSQTTADEIDLGIVFIKIKEGFNNLLINIYQGLAFLIKSWWKLLLIAILGAGVGFVLKKIIKPNKVTSIIVQNNFGSTNYVYHAVAQLNVSIKLKDTIFLKNNGFNPEIIKKVTITPIVNMLELLNNTKYSSKALETLLEKTDFDDKTLTSERFFSSFKKHKIVLITSYEGDDSSIKQLLQYLNNHKKLKEAKKIIIAETKDNIRQLDITIKTINDLMASFSESKKAINPEQIYFSNESIGTDLSAVLEKKTFAINKKENLKLSLTKYDDIVTVLNKPYLHDTLYIIPITEINMAVIFIFIFLFLSACKQIHLKIKKMAIKKESELKV